MVQWFKTKTKEERIVEFNREKLTKEIDGLSSQLFKFKGETSLAIVEEVIKLAYNIQLLEGGKVSTEKEMLIHKGRLQALSDLSSYIERSKTSNKTTHKDIRDVIKLRRTDGNSGSAI